MITKTRYVLAVPDLEQSASYYRDVLGFTIIKIDDPGWRFAERGNCMLMLGECPDALPPSELGDHSYFAYLEVADIDAFYQEIKSKGAQTKYPPKDKPWGMREFPLTTADGHRIMLGQKIK